ncbi:hypothetical protein EMIT0215P_10002 [Pseudomonas serboccidentalis]
MTEKIVTFAHFSVCKKFPQRSKNLQNNPPLMRSVP